MQTAYAFHQTNQHIVAAAIRVITGCTDQPPAPVAWAGPETPFRELGRPPRLALATAYHVAPAQNGWVLAYPDAPGAAPFASALSRQARKLTVSIVDGRLEAWDRGHPAETPPAVQDLALVDARYFRDLIAPEVDNWAAWVHLWGPRWAPVDR